NQRGRSGWAPATPGFGLLIHPYHHVLVSVVASVFIDLFGFAVPARFRRYQRVRWQKSALAYRLAIQVFLPQFRAAAPEVSDICCWSASLEARTNSESVIECPCSC